jgi:hypothetical protein
MTNPVNVRGQRTSREWPTPREGFALSTRPALVGDDNSAMRPELPS